MHNWYENAFKFIYYRKLVATSYQANIKGIKHNTLKLVNGIIVDNDNKFIWKTQKEWSFDMSTMAVTPSVKYRMLPSWLQYKYFFPKISSRYMFISFHCKGRILFIYDRCKSKRSNMNIHKSQTIIDTILNIRSKSYAAN